MRADVREIACHLLPDRGLRHLVREDAFNQQRPMVEGVPIMSSGLART
jgi:hypothetical protein